MAPLSDVVQNIHDLVPHLMVPLTPLEATLTLLAGVPGGVMVLYSLRGRRSGEEWGTMRVSRQVFPLTCALALGFMLWLGALVPIQKHAEARTAAVRLQAMVQAHLLCQELVEASGQAPIPTGSMDDITNVCGTPVALSVAQMSHLDQNHLPK